MGKTIAGNWKMNGLRADLSELRDMADGMPASVKAVLCVPATLVGEAVKVAGAIAIGGQDCHAERAGAHTGDVSAAMLADAGATHVVVGHSERRTAHGETDATVRAKATAALEAGLTPIICIGETDAEREGGGTEAVLARQVEGSVPEMTKPPVVAYEPVWAIGTGRAASPADVAEAHAHIRSVLTETLGEIGSRAMILYGGSVKPANAGELLALPGVDGALVGGASLKASDFLAICAAAPSD